MRNIQTLIEKGDLVFYGSGGNNWEHVAVVVGWGTPTYWGTEPISNGMDSNEVPFQDKCPDGLPDIPLRPLVVERSGEIAYNDFRSLDNTENKIDTISLVHVYDNH